MIPKAAPIARAASTMYDWFGESIHSTSPMSSPNHAPLMAPPPATRP